jgi:hypothetical protein
MIPATGLCRKDAGKSPDPARKHRKSLEHGSSIPTGNCLDFFRWIPVLSSTNWLEIIEKNPKNSRPEYCFHKITGITRNRQFSDRVVRPG